MHMGLVILAGIGALAIFFVSCFLGNNTIIPLVAQSRDFFGLGLCAAGILALVGLYTDSLTGSGRGDSAIIPLVT